jgi:hydrogenase maturation protease
VGIYACRLLAPRVHAWSRDELVVAEVGTAVQEAMHLLEWAEVVLCIDAMQAGGPPGSIYFCEAAELAAEGHTSLHQLGLLGALELLEWEHAAAPATDGGKAERWRRPRVELFGIEPASLELGLGLSPAVQAALPRLLEQLHRWIAASTRRARSREASMS